MANQYHDELGRFCSKNEMIAAVERVKQSGDFDAYFKIRQEYELASQNKVIISEEIISKALRDSYNPANYSGENSPELLRESYNLWLRLDEDKRKDYNLVNIFVNPNTPRDVVEQIIANATPEQAERFIKELKQLKNSNHATQALTYDDLKSLISKMEDKTSVPLYYVIGTDTTNEEKYALLEGKPLATATFANTYPSTLAENSELVAKYEKAIDLIPMDNKNNHINVARLLSRKVSENDFRKALSRLSDTETDAFVKREIAYYVAGNEKLSSSDLKAVANYISDKDFRMATALRNYMTDRKYVSGSPMSEFRMQIVEAYGGWKNSIKNNYVVEHPHLYKTAYSLATDNSFVKRILAGNSTIDDWKMLAVYDVQPSNYRQLKRQFSKEKSPEMRAFYKERLNNTESLLVSDAMSKTADWLQG